MSGVEGVPGGFDFDSFDADLAKAVEGTLESVAPATVEQSEAWDLVEGGRRSGNPFEGEWAVTEAGDSLERERERARELWSEATPFDQRVADATSRVLHIMTPDSVGADGILSAVLDEMAEEDRGEVERSFWDMGYDRALDLRMMTGGGSWVRGSGDEFSHESRAVGPLSGLPGFQSPSVSPGSPAFQGMPAPKGPQGFQPAASLPQPGGYQGAPPSVQSMLTAMSGEPPRTGRAHPERPPAPYEPVPEISEEQKKINKEAIEKIRKDHNLYEGMDPELLRNILLAAGIGAGAAAFGGGGMLGGFGSGVGAFR
jgi:hypothetical protein